MGQWGTHQYFVVSTHNICTVRLTLKLTPNETAYRSELPAKGQKNGPWCIACLIIYCCAVTAGLGYDVPLAYLTDRIM